MGTCWKSFKMGLGLGLVDKPLPLAKKVPIAYLYNGVRLPKLPEWDREKYPYAVIVSAVFPYDGDYFLFVLDDTVTVQRVFGDSIFTDGTCLCYRIENSEFVRYSVLDNTLMDSIVWANHDIYRHPNDTVEPNALVLSASDPIPVYE